MQTRRPKFRVRSWQRLATAVCVAVGLAAWAGADTVTWTGGASTDWMAAGNWSNNEIPSSGNDYVVNTTSPRICTSTATSFAGNLLRLDPGGQLTVAGNHTVSGAGGVVLNGGKVYRSATANSVYTLSATGGFGVQSGTTSDIENNPGVLNETRELVLSGVFSGTGTLRGVGPSHFGLYSSSGSPNFTGVVDINAGTYYVNAVQKSQSVSNAHVNVNAGGALRVQSGTGSVPMFNYLTLNGGRLQAPGTAQTPVLSGALVVQAASKIYFGGNGDLSFGATLSGAARLTVTCGVARTLSVNSPSAFGGSYTGVVAMSGLSGTLNMNGYDTVLGGLAGTVGRVKNDPAGSQTQTRVLTLSLAAGTTNDFSGVLANGNWASEVLALTVTNSGVQKLRGRCTYTGATAVNGGTLTVNGLLSNSVATVAVNLGGTLGGTGRVARPVAVNAGGTLSPGDNGVGTLVTSNLTLAAGCTNVFELGTPGAGDKVAVIGDLTLGDCVVMVQNQPGFRADTYELFTYTGSLSPGSPSPTLILSGPWPARLDYSEPGKVKLVVSRWGPQVLLK